jgi:hypothetical protein
MVPPDLPLCGSHRAPRSTTVQGSRPDKSVGRAAVENCGGLERRSRPHIPMVTATQHAGAPVALMEEGAQVAPLTTGWPQPGRRGRDEAAYFASVVESVGGRDEADLPLVLDLEWSQGLSATGVVAWCDDSPPRFSGRPDGAASLHRGILQEPGQVRAPTLCGVLWIAHYGVVRPTLPGRGETGAGPPGNTEAMAGSTAFRRR